MSERTSYVYETGRGHEAVSFALGELARDPRVFQRGRALVTVSAAGAIDDSVIRDAEAPVILPLHAPHVWEILSERVDWHRYDARSKQMVSREPPSSVISAIVVRGEYPGVRRLAGITASPILRRDGSVSTSVGFDGESGLYYSPIGAVPNVGGKPSIDDVTAAVDTLRDATADFPFATRADQSAAFALILTAVAQSVINGPLPLFWLDANAPGSGKTLLVDLASTIANGVHASRSPYVEDDNELRKRITTHACAGDTFIAIDNAPGGARIGWPSLDAALTGAAWEDRILGRSEKIRLPFRALFAITGNNLQVHHDAARRTIRIRLEAPDENPERRSNFLHSPLLPWALANRGELLGAAITMVRAYLLAGAPDMNLTPLGSFEGWSSIVRGCLVWLDMPDPAACSVALDADADPEASAHRRLLVAWNRAFGGERMAVRRVLERIEREPATYADLREALTEICPAAPTAALPTAKAIGHRLKALRGRWRSDGGDVLAFERAGDSGGSAMWAVVSRQRGIAGIGGVSPAHRPQTVIDDLPSRARRDETNPSKPQTPSLFEVAP